MSTLTVAARYRGPDGSGNGGWVAGAVAALVAGAPDEAVGVPVEVTLRRPPPLDRPLPVETSAAGLRVLDDRAEDGEGTPPVVVEARRVAEDAVEVPTLEPVAFADARAAEAHYAGLRQHPFPGCFACGPDRGEGDGLRIFPGPVSGRPEGVVAATWRPGDDVDLPQVWAALDCPGGWAGGFRAERPMVLGRITAVVEDVPAPGEELIVTGALLGQEGRRTTTASTLRRTDGSVVGRALHTWITLR